MSGILTASASAGTGHLRAAEALATAFAERHPQLHVEHVDLLELAPRWVRAFYGTGYEFVAARAPRLWSGIYRATDGPAAARAIGRPDAAARVAGVVAEDAAFARAAA